MYDKNLETNAAAKKAHDAARKADAAQRRLDVKFKKKQGKNAKDAVDA